jgi:hypothetical protein
MDIKRYKAFLGELGVDSEPPAAILGLPEITEEQLDLFREYLRHDPKANRIRRTIFPRCDERNLSKFLLFYVAQSLDEQFLRSKKDRGQKFRAAIRRRIRESKMRGLPTVYLRQDLELAESMFDVRWQGPANRSTEIPASRWMLVVAAYVRFRAGCNLRPREWASLFEAAYAVIGRTVQVDGDLLRRNLQNFGKAHPAAVPSGQQAAKIIETRHRVGAGTGLLS